MPKMVFIERDGTQKEVEAPLGLSVLEIAHRNSVDIEGACEVCASCHLYVLSDHELPMPSEDEEDMLDQAFFVKKNSRLGCQLKITSALDGLQVQLAPVSDAPIMP